MWNEAILVGLSSFNPKVVLIDDPFADQDGTTKAAMYGFINRCLQSGACVLLGVTSESERSAFCTCQVAVSCSSQERQNTD